VTLPGAAIRESIGDLKQRAQEQIGRLRVETGERDQTAQNGQMMDPQPLFFSMRCHPLFEVRNS